MSTLGKVVWSEGMFLRAQHFQQQDRYVERLVRQRVEGVRSFAWGLRSLVINKNLLDLGKFSLVECSGVFDDGTPFEIPADLEHPTPLDLPVGVSDTIVYLCMPVQHPGAPEIEVGATAFGSSARFRSAEIDVVDAISGSNSSSTIRTAALRLSLMIESDDRSGYHCIGLARVREVSADSRVTLDNAYIPPLLSSTQSETLAGFLNEVVAMLHHRGESLAPRVSGSSSHGVAEIADFLLLQVINRAEPYLIHLSKLPFLHPERLYAAFLGLAGELSTFTAIRKRPDEFAVYRHDDLETVFASVMLSLRRSLSAVIEQSAIQIPLQDRKYGIRVGAIADKTLLTSAGFVLVVKAALSDEVIRRSVPTLIKIGPVEQIRELVNVQLPGIRVRPLAVVPRQLPYHSGAVYFELDSSGAPWQTLSTSGGVAIHLSGDFPDITMELWAIRR